ncbi:MAG: hypothetical protein QOJ01_1909 [Solirubrobacterales bacterium]|jgi:hypothetical protein|nr:hypothetical protein [Solirubrobacterales bacterium]
MINRIRSMPSPALVLAVIALIVAVGGGTFAIASGSSKQIKKIADKEIKKKAPKLSVKHAKSADKADHATSADVATVANTANSANSAYTGFKDSGPAMPNTLTASGNPIATLPIPKAGSYVVTATLYGDQLGSASDLAECVLHAGSNSDEVHVSVPSNGSHEAEIALQTQHTFSAAGSVTLDCTDLGNANSDIHAEAIRIAAVQVASVTNVGL